MRKIVSFCVLISLVSTIISPVFAITTTNDSIDVSDPLSDSGKYMAPMSGVKKIVPQIHYPQGIIFSKLRAIIETNFSISEEGYQSNCISNGIICPNYKYTSIIENALKFIVLHTYIGNEEFYANLFRNTSGSHTSEDKKSLKEILDSIPVGTTLSDWRSFGFGSSIGGDLLDSSFGINFTEDSNSSSMLGAIKQKIKDIKHDNCQKNNSENDIYDSCPWNEDISNIYLPTPEELYRETIYLNGDTVKIEDIKDEIVYQVEFQEKKASTGSISEKNIQKKQISVPHSYTLKYKKSSYTLEEAKANLEKKALSKEEFLVTSTTQKGQLPCKNSGVASVQSECMIALTKLREVSTALSSFHTDYSKYPETIIELKMSYLPKFPQLFLDNFSYKRNALTGSQQDYEIRYIGHIGEGNSGNRKNEPKKDYKAMMSGAVVPDIPTLFAHVPSDSMVLYIRNPASLIDILNQKSNTSQRLSGINASESIRDFMKTFFELEKFEQIEKNLKHEMAIVVNNLDATAPDIIIILSESDRDALSPTGKARVVGSKDGFIFIANSKESLENLMNLTVEKSLKNAPDFHYVWWKKSSLVHDALMFVGDAFFEKMLTLETYLTHYRKYRDYVHLISLQELAWAYGDAFGSPLLDLSELSQRGFSTFTGTILNEYDIVDGLISHKHIGTLKSIKTLPEAHYDLSKISRTELEDYKYNVLQYRDIWRASLDPMGIVINRYGDGMEMDFFMTPIPSSSDRDLQEIQKIFEGTTKNSLSFVTNPRIRMGLLSFVAGFDPNKLEKKMNSDTDVGNEFMTFSKEMLDGKNIFDYLGGEFAFSIGALDPDIFEGWNVEKVDAYLSMQVASETKGKELIEILKKKFIDDMNHGESDIGNSMFGMLAKPLIEDYNNKKIYYVEGIPVPFIGKIGFAYTFIDDFFIIGLNRFTIKNIINIAATGDSAKKNLLNSEDFSKGTFFATLLDGLNMSSELKKLYEKNSSVIPRYLNSMFETKSNLIPLITSYYRLQDHNKRLGQKGSAFQYQLGSLSLSGMNENLVVKMNQNKLISLSGSALELWKIIKKEESFPTAILTEQGIPLETFLGLGNISDILALNIMIQIDHAVQGDDALFRNMTFGMNMGHDEIGLELRVWRKRTEIVPVPIVVPSNPPGSSYVMIITGITLMLMILGSGAWVVIRRRRLSIADIPPVPYGDRVVEESPVIVSSVILPQETSGMSSSEMTIPSVKDIASEAK